MLLFSNIFLSKPKQLHLHVRQCDFVNINVNLKLLYIDCWCKTFMYAIQLPINKGFNVKKKIKKHCNYLMIAQ